MQNSSIYSNAQKSCVFTQSNPLPLALWPFPPHTTKLSGSSTGHDFSSGCQHKTQGGFPPAHLITDPAVIDPLATLRSPGCGQPCSLIPQPTNSSSEDGGLPASCSQYGYILALNSSTRVLCHLFFISFSYWLQVLHLLVGVGSGSMGWKKNFLGSCLLGHSKSDWLGFMSFLPCKLSAASSLATNPSGLCSLPESPLLLGY